VEGVGAQVGLLPNQTDGIREVRFERALAGSLLGVPRVITLFGSSADIPVSGVSLLSGLKIVLDFSPRLFLAWWLPTSQAWIGRDQFGAVATK
jgi:hypothetical protein